MMRLLLVLILLLLSLGLYWGPELNLSTDPSFSSDSADVLSCEVPYQSETRLLTADVSYGSLQLDYFGRGEVEQLNFDVDLANVKYRSDVELEHLQLGCPFVDCIASIDEPLFESSNETHWLAADDLVLGLVHNGIAKAYPMKIMNYHEIVNDQFGCQKVIVTYCPLCNSALAFVAPMIDGETATFGITGRLYKTDLVMYDRVSYSWWSQIEGRVIVGELADASPQLERLQIDVVPWGVWQNVYQDSIVLSRPTTRWPLGNKAPRYSESEGEVFPKDYERDPYPYYRITHADTFGYLNPDQRLRNKVDVIGIELGEHSKAYPIETIREMKLINDVILETAIVLVVDPGTAQIKVFANPLLNQPLSLDSGTGLLRSDSGNWNLDGRAVDEDLPDLERIVGLSTYWFAWAAFHPNTDLYSF